MATETTNLHLTKPDMTDWADIRVINNNWDILDRIFGGTVGDIDKSSTGLVVTKQDETTKPIDFITNSYTDLDTSKLLTLATLKQYLGEGAIVSSHLEKTGYIKFKNGLIIQWGVFNNIPAGGQLVFPQPFTDSCWVVTANDVNKATTNNQIHSFSDYSATSVTVYSQRASGDSNNAWGRYIAIGK